MFTTDRLLLRSFADADIDTIYAQLGIDRIINAIDPQNVSSRGLMRRLGFVFVDNGNPHDLIGVIERPAPRDETPSGF